MTSISTETLQWSRTAQTGKTGMGEPVFGPVAGYPKPVKGVLDVKARTRTDASGLSYRVDALFVSETFRDGQAADTATDQLGNRYTVRGVVIHTSPTTGKPDHAEYELNTVVRPGV